MWRNVSFREVFMAKGSCILKDLDKTAGSVLGSRPSRTQSLKLGVTRPNCQTSYNVTLLIVPSSLYWRPVPPDMRQLVFYILHKCIIFSQEFFFFFFSRIIKFLIFINLFN